MKRKTKQIALRIALLQEEFSDIEILEAINLLEELGSTSSLLKYLSGNKEKVVVSTKNTWRRPLSDERQSKVVLAFKDKDPKKFQLLSEFESLIRRRRVLTELDDIRKLGDTLSKGFSPGKSRKEAISKLMTLIAQLTIDEIQEVISKSLSAINFDGKDSEYQQLAQFIITGKT